ncbi:hypothetical protein F5148DRAFT_1320133 [Russula earlei]|uniref:Uncharacterized protein n=1 Tax=Russula earlei TaxID=71964 RepID=A0ACC0U3Z2_9AGAM|nr:hypothetical protein F5148DRAFT_1320133 [Russula earlei]
MSPPFSEYEKRVRDHALLASTAFLIIIPLGVLVPRYLRTFTNKWWRLHALLNLLIAAPLVYAAWGMAASARNISHAPIAHHQRVGYAILSLYTAQVLLGPFIHFIRIPFLPIAHRPLQNYFHAVLGLTILAMAGYQIHYGLYTEWELMTGNVHPVKQSLKHAWLALLIVSSASEPAVSHDQFVLLDILVPVCDRVGALASPVQTGARSQGGAR